MNILVKPTLYNRKSYIVRQLRFYFEVPSRKSLSESVLTTTSPAEVIDTGEAYGASPPSLSSYQYSKGKPAH